MDLRRKGLENLDKTALVDMVLRLEAQLSHSFEDGATFARAQLRPPSDEDLDLHTTVALPGRAGR